MVPLRRAAETAVASIKGIFSRAGSKDGRTEIGTRDTSSGGAGKVPAYNSSHLLASLSDAGRYQLLVDAITDYAVYLLDPEGRVTSWNPGAERFKGYSAEEILGELYARFFTEEDRKRDVPRQNLERARKEGRFEAEGWRVRKNGTRFWCHVVIDPIFDPQGELVGFAKVTRDLTERMHAQVELERTREALFQSQKMEAIGRLTGGVAHDFNNLLTVILGSLEMLQKRLPNDPQLHPLLENARRAATRGATLTQRMLAFARRQELRLGAVDIPALVRAMADMIGRTLGPDITVDTHFPLALPKALTDGAQLESALLNLAVNARDAMPKGGKLTISAEVAEAPAESGIAPGRYLKLIVADTGEGMDELTAKRATEPFFTTKGVGKGTGLGLSMVQGLVQQSGGLLEIRSRLNVGTSVELWLPLADRAERLEEPQQPELDRPEADRRLRVLVVDDDALVLMNTISLLQDMDHEVLEASSGDQALELLAKNSDVDLVITDYAMPKMTGTQLAAAIHKKRPNLPIILASGYADLPQNEKSSLPRLPKPFFGQDLAKALRPFVQG